MEKINEAQFNEDYNKLRNADSILKDGESKLEALSKYVEQLKTVKFDDVSNAEKLLLEEEEDEKEIE